VNYLIDNQPKKTKAFIAGVNLNDPNFYYYMTELRELALANNLDVVGQGSQKAENIVAGTYFGVGSLTRLKIWPVNYMLKS
jgi:GTP-binding protein HflX